MTSLPRAESAVNGVAGAVHTQHHAERPVMGSSEGAASREAQREAQLMAMALRAAKPEDAEEVLRTTAHEMGRWIRLGLLDRADAGDLLRPACVINGLTFRIGEDGVQAIIARHFEAGVQAAVEELAEEEERKAEERAKDPWNDPDMTLLEDRRGDLPPFPVDALPPAWQPWLERAARGAGVMPDHVILPLLAVVAGLIGAARRVQASRPWSEPICLWTSVIGFSGTGKTPGLGVVRRVMSRIERSRSDDVGAAQAAHEKRAAEAKAVLRRWRKEVEAAIKAEKPAPDRPKEAEVPPPFVAPRFYCSDATIERLAVLIEARPRGMLMIVDELAGLFGNMGRYASRGSDREFWLEAWNGGHHSVERLSRPPISLPHLLVSMTGGFQPDKLARSFERADDGMYARHLFGWPAEPGYRPLTDDVDEADPELQEALMRLIDLPAGSGTEIEPRYLPLDDAARAAFETFRQEIDTGKAALDGREREWWSKGPGQVLRLAGTLAYLAWAMPAAQPTTKKGLEQLMETARRAEEPTGIEAALVESAVRLWRGYFWLHARAALRQMGAMDRHRDARRVLRWLRAHRHAEVSREDVRRDALAQRLDAEGTQRLLDDLVKVGWLRARTVPTRSRPARRWDVNPRLLSEES
jgi:hypothetical protein